MLLSCNQRRNLVRYFLVLFLTYILCISTIYLVYFTLQRDIVKIRLIILSTCSLCFFIFFVAGCTQYKSPLLKEELSSLQGTSISTLLSSWGKPSQFMYNADGSSQLQWKNIYSDKETLSFLLSHSSLDKLNKYSSLICEFSVDVDSLGKIKRHTVLCSENLQSKQTIAFIE